MCGYCSLALPYKGKTGGNLLVGAVKGQDEHLKADDAAEAAEHLVDGDVMVGVGGQARVVHARDALMLL